ncbi:aspartate 1-decarboxylase [Bradyrhizobium zhanjiangense]|uniref:aspartate 1-decarboxylase n=1 Tax=Bradyrhizobium zhanjiangense TaxID=1325107 RepID=UPI0023ECD23C|nr:aspartate 1-decarboxylase [Bradyrhizobium zhanjiangense]
MQDIYEPFRDAIKGKSRASTLVVPRENNCRVSAHRLVMPGDKIIIVAYASFDEAEAKIFKPRVVLVDRENRMLPG